MKHDNELEKIENNDAAITEKTTTVTTAPVAATTVKKTLPTGAIFGIMAAIALVVGVSGFAAGMQFQKGTGASSLSQQGGPGGMGGFGQMNQNGSFGTVTAISDNSITITTMGGPGTSSSSGTSKSYAINGSTSVTIDGSTGTVNEISKGDTVMIEADSSSSSTAASIRVGNGGMQGDPMGTQGSSSTTNDTQTRTN